MADSIVWAIDPRTPADERWQRDPVGTTKQLNTLLEKVGIQGSLRATARLLEQSEALGLESARRRTEAETESVAVIDRIIDGSLAIDDLAETIARLGPWLNTSGAGDPMAAQVLGVAAERARSRAVLNVAGEADSLYRQLATIAASIVDDIAGCGPVPKELYSANTVELANTAVRLGVEGTWSQLVRLGDRFEDVHAAADILRATSGVASVLTSAAPSTIAWRVLQWEKAVAEWEELKRIPRPLRLRWAHERGWQLGLWSVSDHATRDQQRQPKGGFLARLGGKG